jgi:hypothetical protein
VRMPSVATSRDTAGAWRSGRMTSRCVAAPTAAPNPTPSASATGMGMPS